MYRLSWGACRLSRTTSITLRALLAIILTLTYVWCSFSRPIRAMSSVCWLPRLPNTCQSVTMFTQCVSVRYHVCPRVSVGYPVCPRVSVGYPVCPRVSVGYHVCPRVSVVTWAVILASSAVSLGRSLAAPSPRLSAVSASTAPTSTRRTSQSACRSRISARRPYALIACRTPATATLSRPSGTRQSQGVH